MYLIFDIGGTKTRIASTNDLQTLEAVERFDTPRTYREGLNAMLQAAEKLTQGKRVVGAAGGIRGPLNHEKTGIVSENTLTDWVGRNLVRDLGEKLGCPVTLENDAALVGLGEVTFGAGQGCEIVAYHTVSTGVGGARFVHGRLDVVSTGFEPGHQILDLDRTILGGAENPTLEALVSGAALEKRRGVKPYEIPQTDHVWDELARYLAYGLKNTIVYWSPDRIILGGSMIVGDPNIPVERIVFHTKKLVEGFVPCPPIVAATLKDEGGLYGAMALLAGSHKR
jgi:predicted NBD/HSP70 family sugar kinase